MRRRTYENGGNGECGEVESRNMVEWTQRPSGMRPDYAAYRASGGHKGASTAVAEASKGYS